MGRIYIDVKDGIISGQDEVNERRDRRKKNYVPGAGNREKLTDTVLSYA